MELELLKIDLRNPLIVDTLPHSFIQVLDAAVGIVLCPGYYIPGHEPSGTVYHKINVGTTYLQPGQE
jgi:hypothetical protein